MKIRNFLHHLTIYLSLAASILMGYAAYLFLRYNQPIIKNMVILSVLLFLPIVFILFASIREQRRTGREDEGCPRERAVLIRVIFFVFTLLTAGILVYAFLNAALLDYFQPFSLYDDVIYISLAGFVMLIIRMLIDAVRYLLNYLGSRHTIYFNFAILFILALMTGWGLLQGDFDYTNISGEPLHLFVGGSGDYDIYRIPSLITILEGSTLMDGTLLDDDLVLAFAEARRNGSLDNGDIDLVMRRSLDGGKTWDEEVVIRQWEDGIGKIGNPTPVFNRNTGELLLFHIAGVGPKSIWYMLSPDGGASFSEPVEIAPGIVGPGHGIQIVNGEFAGRLIVPANFEGISSVLISDDDGASWSWAAPTVPGNENEVVELEQGLGMVVRPNHPVAQPHDPFFTQFSFSSDGGKNWNEPVEVSDIPTPICMASLTSGLDGSIYYSTPDDHYSRALMTIFQLNADLTGYEEKALIYAGPSGYSDLAPLSDGSMLLLFENGAVEYDERLTLVRFSP